MDVGIGRILICITDAYLDRSDEGCHGLLAVTGVLMVVLRLFLCAESGYMGFEEIVRQLDMSREVASGMIFVHRKKPALFIS